IKHIFSRKGEEYFRELEREVIKELSRRSRCVIATGGGVVLSPGNMTALRSNGIIICLKSTPEVILKRIGSNGSRPLLDVLEPIVEINRLLAERKGLYNGDLSLDTSCMDPETAASRIKAFVTSEKQSSSFSMEFTGGACRVISGSRLSEHLYQYIEEFYPSGKVLIISNPTIYGLWGNQLEAAFSDCYLLDWCLIPDGEKYKNMDSLTKVYDKAVQMKLTRDSLIVGFGGGVIGDIAGFAAATYMRGIPYIQMPTTLLSQADSSIGGKTAINYKEVKNLIGSFYQPAGVIADTTFLLTLPPREFKSGLAEVIKYGIINDKEFFEYLEKNIDGILKQEQKYMIYITQQCCSIKASFVQKDERDQGLRMLLNYGHTIGHAIEAATGYTEFFHGEAVALGMEAAAYIAENMGLIDKAQRTRQSRLLSEAGLPTRYPGMDMDTVQGLMKNDKKAHKGQVRFVLPTGIGQAALFENVTEGYVKEALEYLCR
ncbi:MAG TPA: 3-dehydroquinate synthase, partial [Candidatus Nitrosocosmicus sp.]|nr:3-dehydroquinate synthase [Candidatus Nitrosocosmicus sp.]